MWHYVTPRHTFWHLHNISFYVDFYVFTVHVRTSKSVSTAVASASFDETFEDHFFEELIAPKLQAFFLLHIIHQYFPTLLSPCRAIPLKLRSPTTTTWRCLDLPSCSSQSARMAFLLKSATGPQSPGTPVFVDPVRATSPSSKVSVILQDQTAALIIS